ncbi:MAG: hypothetical protein ACP5D9_08040, partial [Mariniphaga sp.]
GAPHLISNPQSCYYKYYGALHHSHRTTEKPLLKKQHHHDLQWHINPNWTKVSSSKTFAAATALHKNNSGSAAIIFVAAEA